MFRPVVPETSGREVRNRIFPAMGNVNDVMEFRINSGARDSQ